MIDAPSYYDPNDRLVEPRIVAERLGVRRETIYRWMKDGYLKYIVPRGGGERPRKLVYESEIRRHLSERVA